MEKQEDYRIELVKRAMEIMTQRRDDPKRSREVFMAYDSALWMLQYALEENEECLNQFAE